MREVVESGRARPRPDGFPSGRPAPTLRGATLHASTAGAAKTPDYSIRSDGQSTRGGGVAGCAARCRAGSSTLGNAGGPTRLDNGGESACPIREPRSSSRARARPELPRGCPDPALGSVRVDRGLATGGHHHLSQLGGEAMPRGTGDDAAGSVTLHEGFGDEAARPGRSFLERGRGRHGWHVPFPRGRAGLRMPTHHAKVSALPRRHRVDRAEPWTDPFRSYRRSRLLATPWRNPALFVRTRRSAALPDQSPPPISSVAASSSASKALPPPLAGPSSGPRAARPGDGLWLGGGPPRGSGSTPAAGRCSSCSSIPIILPPNDLLRDGAPSTVDARQPPPAITARGRKMAAQSPPLTA